MPIDRIRLRRDFLAANAGVRVPTSAFVLLVKPGVAAAARAGFTVSRKVGNAVARNRARRRLREAARLTMPEHAIPGADHVFIARPADAELSFAQLLADTRHALQKAQRKLAGGR
ncbi:MAG: ribonuclease P protein component [Sandaracinobacteroides sp.]